MKISIWKKYKFYRSYKKILKDNNKNLLDINLRVDRTSRIYTVLNIPQDVYGEYNLRKIDIDRISEPYIQEYVKQIGSELNRIGLQELYRIYDIQKVDKYSYLIIIGFSLLDTVKLAKRIWYRLLPLSILIIITIIFYHKLFN